MDEELMSVDLGFDRFQAQVLTEACRAEGVKVELLTMDDSGTSPGLAAGVEHRLLIRRQDFDRVREILQRSDPRR